MAGPTPAKKAAPRKAAARSRTPGKLLPTLTAVDEQAGAEVEEFDGFDLDTLDKKTVLPNVTDKVFQFKLDGHWYEMKDPRDVDWKKILGGVADPIMFMRLAMDDPDQADQFMDAELPAWKLSALFDTWQKHYNVESMVDLNRLLSGNKKPGA